MHSSTTYLITRRSPDLLCTVPPYLYSPYLKKEPIKSSSILPCRLGTMPK